MQASNTSVSIALATYNGELYLTQQLESLANQTTPPFELVVTDDQSSDRTIAILRSFASSASFPVFIHRNPSRLGYANNFIHAAGLCKGDVIAFCDQDDVWRTDKLERCSREFSRPDVGLVVHNAREVDEQLIPLNVFTPNLKHSEVLSRGVVHPGLDWPIGCVIIVRRTLMQQILALWSGRVVEQLRHPRPHMIAHDSVTYFAARSLSAVSYRAEPLIDHRLHGKNTASSSVSRKDYVFGVLSAGADDYRPLGEMTMAAAELYEHMAEAAHCEELEHGLRNVATRFRRRAASLLARSQQYVGDSRYKRIKAIIEMVRTGSYDRVSDGGLGRKAIAKDIFWAMLGRR